MSGKPEKATIDTTHSAGSSPVRLVLSGSISESEKSKLAGLPEISIEYISKRPDLDWKLWNVFAEANSDEEAAHLWRAAVEAGANPRAGSTLTTEGILAFANQKIADETYIVNNIRTFSSEIAQKITDLSTKLLSSTTQDQRDIILEELAPLASKAEIIRKPGYLESVKEQFESHLEALSEMRKFVSPAHAAAKGGYVQLLRAMLDSGADPEALAVRDVDHLKSIIALPKEAIAVLSDTSGAPVLPQKTAIALLFNPMHYKLSGLNYAQTVMNAAAENLQIECVSELIRHGVSIDPASAASIMTETFKLMAHENEDAKNRGREIFEKTIKLAENLVDIASKIPASGEAASAAAAASSAELPQEEEQSFINSAAKSLSNLLAKSKLMYELTKGVVVKISEIPSFVAKLSNLDEASKEALSRSFSEAEKDVVSEELKTSMMKFILATPISEEVEFAGEVTDFSTESDS